MINNSEAFIERARELRRNQTDAETFFWAIVRNRALGGFKFRRQKIVGSYILDFYCHERKLAVEFDGGGHVQPNQKKYDAVRDAYLEGQGICVRRYWNNQLFEELEAVLEDVWEALRRE
jgi:very-short-patch-repair endonuclease